MCYQWQVQVYNELHELLEDSTCFEVHRVGLVEGKLSHNWIAIIGASPPHPGFGNWDKVPPDGTSVYLDPWWRSGPGAYCHDGTEWDDEHPAHNFIGTAGYLGDPEKPHGIGGFYRDDDGAISCQTWQYEGWWWW